jgi:hypothetical protein
MWKANGKTDTLLLFLDSLFPKPEIYRQDASLETKQSGGKLLPHLDLWGGGGVFLGEISSTGTTARRITKKRRRNITATKLECGM